MEEYSKKSLKDTFKHAFAIEEKSEYKFSEDELKILNKVADKIVKIGLVTPAILFLETLKPLNYIGSQTMVFFKPIVSSLFNCNEYDLFSKMLEHRSCIEELLKVLDQREGK